MPVDLDAPNRAALAVFGEAAQGNGAPSYTPKGGTTFPLDGVFFEDWTTLKPGAGILGRVTDFSTTKPSFSTRLALFPAGVSPKQGDAFVRGNGAAYEVADVQQADDGYVILLLK